MASIELGGTLTALKNERVLVNRELQKLDKAIAVLDGLVGTPVTTSNGHTPKRMVSAAARRRIGKAQKLRWAKVRQQAAKK